MPLPFIGGFALMFAPIGRFLKAIPGRVWIGIAILLAIGAMIWWHNSQVSGARKEGYAAGVKYEGARIAKKAAEIKAKADGVTSKITAHLRTKHDEKVVVINRSADTLRLSGPGKAACRGNPDVPASPGRSVAGRGSGNAAPVGLPVEDRIAVPFGWVVDQAERCDMNRAEVLSWREWHRQQTEAWKDLELP